MKAMISAAVIALIMTSTANAQQDSTKVNMPHKPPMGFKGRDGKEGKDFKHSDGTDKFADRKSRFEKGKERFAQHIQLTEDQKKQGKIIRENTSKQIAALYNNDKLTMGDFKQQKAAILKAQKEKLDGLLTAEQKAKIAENKKRMVDNRQVQVAARLERMKINLGLKDDQVAKIKTAQTQLHEKMKALHEDATLLPEQKKAQMKALMDEEKESLKNVLTAEQLAKLESHKGMKEGRR
ncbi:hypothetical protein ACFOW1_11595 [Parasediminibacterium paludis]|uniref:LTXXQ motif family protein n=1 Tax=Parasediminibacterium paludis TaxID=908966 RepID=A0ABV8Q0E6_9BACT